jgi:hypothetical protein
VHTENITESVTDFQLRYLNAGVYHAKYLSDNRKVVIKFVKY